MLELLGIYQQTERRQSIISFVHVKMLAECDWMVELRAMFLGR